MRKFYFLLIASLFFISGNAQIINFSDANFKAKLLAALPNNYIATNVSGNVFFKIDANSDNEIQISEALQVKTLNLYNSNISSLVGIEYFTNLERLLCDNNQLQSLDVSNLINLIELGCGYNQLSTINTNGLINLKNLYCSNNQFSSLNISGLPNLQRLHCTNNQLSSLDVTTFANLQDLNCSSNQMISIDVNGLINLEKLDCSINQLSSINLNGLTNLYTFIIADNQLQTINVNGLLNLFELNCSNNQLPSLNLSGMSNLQRLYCNSNQLPSLNLSDLINLRALSCYSNLLTNLDFNGLTNLGSISCSDNQLQSLNVSFLSQLSTLLCEDNFISSLNVSGLTNLQMLYCYRNNIQLLNVTGATNLKHLDCTDNLIHSLNLSGFTELEVLSCRNNLLTTIDASDSSKLNSFTCGNNQLTTLFAKNGKNESNFNFSNNENLQYICADEGQIAGIQSELISLGYTNCHVNSYCSFSPGGTFYTIHGNDKYDMNNNGCDNADMIYPNLKLSFSEGTNSGFLIADTTGEYYYDVQNGTHTITPSLENAAYFNVSPTISSVTFPAEISPFIQNFCITPNGIHHDLEIVIIPLSIARPGFDATYKMIYKNKGTYAQSGTVSFAFNDAVIDLVNANPAISSQVINYLNWDFTDLLPFETRTITVTLNANTPIEIPPVNGGDILNFTASVNSTLTDETPGDNTFILNQTVINSFDPNDKTCLEGNTITPEMVGKEVHYLIRFENTGTANAENIVVKDMIDTAKFDINSLIPIDGSHPFVTKISNTNKVEFIFENIQLPFDDANNDGYVAFKIKTKPTLVVGNTLSNTASIYFDYNFPIITNTATTTVALLANADFTFEDYFKIYPNPANDVLNIETKQTIEVTSINIYNTLGQIVLVIPNAQQTKSVDVSNLKMGNYFLKINSDKGSSSVKFVKM